MDQNGRYNIAMGTTKVIKNCKNCAYFVQHYSLINGSINETAYGHCMHIGSKDKRNMVVKTDLCKAWVYMRIPKIIGLKDLSFKIYYMAQKLEELSEELDEISKKRK